VFQVIRDLFFRPPDDGGDFLCRKRTFLQEGADLMPDGLRFLRPLARRIPVVPHAAAYAAADRRVAQVARTVAMFPPPFSGLRYGSGNFPLIISRYECIIATSGPRQSGKSTLLRRLGGQKRENGQFNTGAQG
jgi:hypothetical protein